MMTQTSTPQDWWRADRSQLYLRAFQLQSELSVAAALLELREDDAAARGEPRSTAATELMAKWRTLINAKPSAKEAL
jgi:hypothetical protein